MKEEKRSVWITDDGVKFDNIEEAVKHEVRCAIDKIISPRSAYGEIRTEVVAELIVEHSSRVIDELLRLHPGMYKG